MIVPLMLSQPVLLLKGLPFALTLMSILLAHEMGHYIVGRRYNAPVSLPYFIPMPLAGLFGTMGAVIVQRAPFENRKSLFDIGIAGPLAGLAVALPLLILGLATSTVGPIQAPALLEGNSILYLSIKYLIFGRILPSHGVDVMLNPIAWAGLGRLADHLAKLDTHRSARWRTHSLRAPGSARLACGDRCGRVAGGLGVSMEWLVYLGVSGSGLWYAPSGSA